MQFQSLKEKILQAEPRVIGITQNINTKATNVVLGQKNKTLWGKDHVTDAVGKTAFSISPMSFYQVNTTCMQSLYEGAAEFAQLTGREIVWDLYCGIGTIGQFMAERAAKIIGIEIVPEAIKNARENAKRNRIENTEYYCGKVEILAPKLAAQGMWPDVVILDPPRKGCDERLLKTVAELAPKRVVYISCKPSTLARDLKYLTAAGFQAEQIRPYNMFPRSAHVETVVLLSKGEIDSKKVRVEFSLEDMDMSGFQKGATYEQIKAYVLEHSGLKVSSMYISQIKRKCGLEVGQNYNLSKKEDAKVPQCPPEKESAIREALKFYNLI